MNWTDFLFGAIAGISLSLITAAFFLFRIMRPHIAAATAAAKAKPSRAKTQVWPVSFDSSNRPAGEGPPKGNS